MCFSDSPSPAAPAPLPPPPTPLYVNKGPGESESQGTDFGASRRKLRIELNPTAGSSQGTGIVAPGV